MSLTYSEAVALTLVAGLCALALALAVQPLLWSPAPSAQAVYDAHAP